MEVMIDQLIGLPKKSIIIILGKPQNNYPDEIVYIIKSYFFGLYKRKLYLFFHKGQLRDYYIGL